MLKDVPCTRPWTGFELVDHLGDVRPCCWGKISCGNVNNALPSDIWAGPGFQLYRERMLAGDTASICDDSCPILQKNYKEVCGPAINHSISDSNFNPRSVAPAYLRVVPTTKCNLRCKMCYQIGTPLARLPDNLFELLEPWIHEAQELLILGGETFIAKECLAWIKQVTPEQYKHCRLAAITNGLGFTTDVCTLISERQWSWILVSIDAASSATFKTVRGGDWSQLQAGLQRLAAVRARQPFELRFSFTLQKSNINDLEDFLDLCADYNAMPEYTVVSGSRHGEGPVSDAEIADFYQALDALGKRVSERGFDDLLLAVPRASLKERQLGLHG